MQNNSRQITCNSLNISVITSAFPLSAVMVSHLPSFYSSALKLMDSSLTHSQHSQEYGLCFSSLGCALSCLGYCPWYFSSDTKANPVSLCEVFFFLFSWQREALLDFGVVFRGSSRKDNWLPERIGTMNTNGLQQELCSRQYTHTHILTQTLPLSLLVQTK